MVAKSRLCSTKPLSHCTTLLLAWLVEIIINNIQCRQQCHWSVKLIISTPPLVCVLLFLDRLFVNLCERYIVWCFVVHICISHSSSSGRSFFQIVILIVKLNRQVSFELVLTMGTLVYSSVKELRLSAMSDF